MQFGFKLGFDAVAAGRYEEASQRFRQAARYADKPSQMALALLARDGLGQPKDLALA